jgi:hypothetical protein
MVHTFLKAALSISMFIGCWARAEVLFEGFYKVQQSGKPVGFYISRYEFDAKKKQFLAKTFLRIESGAMETTESIQSAANENFFPVSYAYTAIGGGVSRTVDARVDKEKLISTITQNKKTEKVIKDLPKNTLLSGFLIYAILRSPQGLKANIKFDYDAVAEELGDVKRGTVALKDFENFQGQKALKIENTFLDTKSHNLVSEKGEVFSTQSIAQRISIELVSTPQAAFGDFKIPQQIIKNLFGDMPLGNKNALASSASTPSGTVAISPKKEGVPQGKGLQLKNGPSTDGK